MQIQTNENAGGMRKPASLVGSDSVEGTAVYRPNGDRIGTIDRVMIDKRRGKVAYAVMGFGGFLGLGKDHYPIPWALLNYNEDLGGYVIAISDSQLKGAPKFAESDWDFGDRVKESALFSYYGTPPYW